MGESPLRAPWVATSDMLTGQVADLGDSLPYWGLAALLAVGLRFRSGPGPTRTRPILVGVAALAALAHGASLAWLSDDAFISFRYADNLVHGHGLLFNPGEHVEGYTNFLWTLIVALGILVGVAPTITATCLGLLSLGALPWLTERLVQRLRTDPPGVLPVAALATAGSYSLASYGTSGLETMFATALMAIALERAAAGAVLVAGTCGVLATLAHPDHGLLYAGLGAALLFARTPLRTLVRYALPFAALFVPYFAWRTAYYGELVPNTFHAKSGHLAYYTQGVVYVMTFLFGAGAWALLFGLRAGTKAANGRLFGAYLAFAVLPYTVYVAKIGGDFMFARLLVVVLPPLLVCGELAVDRWFARGQRWRTAWGMIALSLTAAPFTLFGETHSRWQISDEGRFYRLESLIPLEIDSYYFQVGKDMRAFLRGLPRDPWVAFDCVGMTGYLSGLPIVDRWGLTDRHVAHQELLGRGRPGHEKRAHPAYLVARGVHFADVPVFPEPASRWTRAVIGKTPFWTVHFDPEIMGPLAERREVRLPSPAAALARLSHRASPRDSREDVACKAWVLDEVYVERWGKPAEREQLYATMLASGSNTAPEAIAELGFLGDASHDVDFASAIHFDPGGQGPMAGADIEPLLTSLPVARQSDVFGNDGPFLNTFDARRGDGLTGTFRSHPFPLRGDVMELRVGGGRDIDDLRVALWVDGVMRFSATGCNSEMLGRRLWFIKPLRGQQAVLEIRDGSRAGWGHLLVDEVRQWLPADAGR